nr:retrotransposon-related protein [Tanacetum cinerariifolium]
MDENAIRLLLKEQSDAFTAHLIAIQTELEATKGLVQTRHGGGDDQGSAIPRLSRIFKEARGQANYSWGAFFVGTCYRSKIGGSTVFDRYMHNDRDCGDISILNSLIGHGSPRSLQLWGTIGSTEDVHVLIDNGSTHNFVRPDVVEKCSCRYKRLRFLRFYIGSGESLSCENVCSQVTLCMQGLAIEVDLYVLPMKGYDLVLGIQWMQKLGKVMHDYAQQTMEFTLVNTKYALKDDESLCMKWISLHCIQALLDTEDVYGVYEFHSLPMEAEEVAASAEVADS